MKKNVFSLFFLPTAFSLSRTREEKARNESNECNLKKKKKQQPLFDFFVLFLLHNIFFIFFSSSSSALLRAKKKKNKKKNDAHTQHQRISFYFFCHFLLYADSSTFAPAMASSLSGTSQRRMKATEPLKTSTGTWGDGDDVGCDGCDDGCGCGDCEPEAPRISCERRRPPVAISGAEGDGDPSGEGIVAIDSAIDGDGAGACEAPIAAADAEPCFPFSCDVGHWKGPIAASPHEKIAGPSLFVSLAVGTQAVRKSGAPTAHVVAFCGVKKTALSPSETPVISPPGATTAASAFPSSSMSTFLILSRPEPPRMNADDVPPATAWTVPTFASGNDFSSLLSKKTRDAPEDARYTCSAVTPLTTRSAAPLTELMFIVPDLGATGPSTTTAPPEGEIETPSSSPSGIVAMILIGDDDDSKEALVEMTSSLRGETATSIGTESLPVSTKTARFPVLTRRLSGAHRAMLLIGASSLKRRLPVDGFSPAKEAICVRVFLNCFAVSL